MPIHVLDQNTIDKIAAGEVIERPSSVVKELVENAIDAKATAITIEIKDGGISFIRITDNGVGINTDEIPLAFLRHSTSKIRSVEDLMSVSSLGFRGEALSSIAAVSQVELITKTADSFTGSRYVIEGGSEISLEEVGAPDGTTFIVRNLFYNTPVRRKFLKTAATEAGYINSLIEHLSLSHPDISFRFISNNQNKLHTSGNMDLKDIIYNVYGRDITKNLISINDKTQDIEITGYIGKPVVCRGNRAYENYYINGRYIKSKIITSAMEEAYRGFIMLHNYPFTAIHFKINPAILDVNVHPTKMELRFSKNEFVYEFVKNAVHNALKKKDLIPEVNVSSSLSKSQIENRKPDFEKKDQTISLQKNDVYKAPALKPLPVENVTGAADNMLKINDVASNAIPPKRTSTDYTLKSRLPEPFEVERSKQMKKYDDLVLEENKAKDYGSETLQEKNEQLSFFDSSEAMDKNDSAKNYKIIGQLFDTYWLIEFEDKFYMMDQHAAHEKILYERMMKNLKNNKSDTQMLMPPIVLSVNMQEEQVLTDNMDIFNRIGYEIENFGGREYKVTGVPADLPDIDKRQLLTDILDEMVENSSVHDPELITQRIATMSCKAAVKGNNRLSIKEAQALVAELMQADNPYNCPHGRPTMIMMSKYEIEKKFKRIV